MLSSRRRVSRARASCRRRRARSFASAESQDADVAARTALAAPLVVVADEAVRLVERDRTRHLLDGIEDQTRAALRARPRHRDVEELPTDTEAARGRSQVHLAQL